MASSGRRPALLGRRGPSASGRAPIKTVAFAAGVPARAPAAERAAFSTRSMPISWALLPFSRTARRETLPSFSIRPMLLMPHLLL